MILALPSHKISTMSCLWQNNGPWSEILKHTGLIKERACCRIGNSSTGSFWKDNWVSNSALAKDFPLLFAHTVTKNAQVSEVWSQATKSLITSVDCLGKN